MKKLLIFCVVFMLLLTSCSENNISENNLNSNTATGKKIAQKSTKSSTKPVNKNKDEGIQGLTLLYNNNLDVKLDGFNTVFLNVDGVRISSAPYRTDFKVLGKMEQSIEYLETNNTDFFINITSGPGFSPDENIFTIFSDRVQALYFSQMAKEIVRRYVDDPNFKGISIDIGTTNVPEDVYYDTLDYIINNIRVKYADVPIVLNLYPLSFENDYKDFPNIAFNNIIVNAPITFDDISYPGNAKYSDVSFQLNKNILLSKLQALRDIADKNKLNIIISLKTPWIDHSEILLQDLFEITKMLGFNYNLCYGNSQDIFDLYVNKSVASVIERHSD